MNRAVRKMMNRRCALKASNSSMYGGGLAVNALAPYTSANGVPIESRGYTDECYDVLRPGEIRAEANPALAQVGMAGGRRSRRKQRGGNKGGFGVDPSMSVGGEGPIAAPVNVPIPCDARAGSAGAFATQQMGPDPRAYGVGYSVTANQTGGAYVDTRIPNFSYAATMAGGKRTRRHRGGNYGGNAYDASCYRAPGSSMPVYPAQSVGFNFSPSTAAGASYSDGVTPFNEVNQVVARTGGARRSYRKRKVQRKSRKAHRKGKKSNRK